jgi:CheY-like chemotaxis protein
MPPASERFPVQAASANADHTVLLIENDLAAVDLIAGYLRSTPFGLVTAENGIDGIAAARANRPVAILLDILLPDIDGWEVLRRLKADPELRDIPVVVATIVEERELGMALGAADYLLKPIHRENLMASLDRCLPKTDGASGRVLAIDDDAATLAVLRAVLEPTGTQLVTADGGRQGLREAQALSRDGGLDLVICDLLMPDVDGFEVIAQLKASPSTRTTPILVLTGRELTDEDKRRLNGRVIGVCQKGPDAGTALIDWLASAVGQNGNGAGQAS